MYLNLPFYGTYSYAMKRKLTQLFRKYYPQINFRIVMTNNNILSTFIFIYLFFFADR